MSDEAKNPPPVAFSPRPVAEDDFARLAEIEKRVHPSPWAESAFRGETEKPYSHTLLLTDDETDTQIAGYIVYWLMMEGAQILNVAVDLPYRRRGYAKKLVRHAIQEALAKGMKAMTLDVRKSNLPAVQLYQSLRFSITHVRKNFYSDGEDAYQMTLQLEGEGIIGF